MGLEVKRKKNKTRNGVNATSKSRQYRRRKLFKNIEESLFFFIRSLFSASLKEKLRNRKFGFISEHFERRKIEIRYRK